MRKNNVSVIITTYKRPDLLSKAIESVLRQSFDDFELIIIDDNPLGVSLSYDDPRIIYVKNKENLKGAKSLNVGLRMAKGEYVAIIDDDDEWISDDKLEKQVKFLNENPDYVIVGTSSINVSRKTGKDTIGYTGGFDLSNIESFILMTAPFAHSSIMYRRNIVMLLGGYSEDLPRAKDIDLYIRLTKVGKFGFLPNCFIRYREMPLSIKGIHARCEDSFYHRKVIWRHRKDFPNFLIAYLKITLRYFILKIANIKKVGELLTKSKLW